MTNIDTIARARSLLFVPGNRPDRFDRAATTNADVVIIDLEDAIADQHKHEARAQARRWLTAGNPAMVRINAVGTVWHGEDVEMVARAGCPVLLPKADSSSDLTRLATRLPAGTPIVPLIETATGVAQAAHICAAAVVVRPAFGSVDLAMQLGVDDRSHPALHHARSSLMLAAAAAGCAAPIDGVTTDLADHSTLKGDLAHAADLGFTAKLCIHPAQVDLVNTHFTPTDTDVSWARTVLDATTDGSVNAVCGQMVDRPILLRAQAILARAARCKQD